MSAAVSVIPEVPLATRDEEALVGSLVLYANEVAPRIAPIVSGADYWDDDLGKCHDVVMTLFEAGRPVGNLKWLNTELPRHGISASVVTRLIGIVHDIGTWGDCTYHAEHVRDMARLRRLITTGTGLLKRAYDSTANPADVSAWLESQVAALGLSTDEEAKSLGDVAADAIAEIEAAAKAPSKPGIFTGLSAIDEFCGAMLGGELVIPAARTGSGKTAYAMQAAMHAASRGHGVLVVSLEMQAAELAKRIIAGRAGIDSRKLRSSVVTPHELQNLKAKQQEISQLPIKIWAPASATLAKIRAQARYHASRGDLRLLIVDYIGLVEPAPQERHRDRHLQVAAVSGGLKKLAKELDCVVYGLAQLNRQGEESPRLTHLRESGAIEQDADAVLLLSIDPQPKNGTPFGQTPFREASCNIAKFRHGQTGTVRLKWYPQTTEFRCEDDYR